MFVGLAGDEIFDIRMIHAQDGHIGAAPAAALGDFAEGMVIDAQKADRAGGLSGGCFHQRTGRAQAGEGKAVAAAGLLDEGGIAQGLENAGRILAHVIGDGQHKTGSQLPQRCAGPGEGGGVGEELAGGEQVVILFRQRIHILFEGSFPLWQCCRPPARTSLQPFRQVCRLLRGAHNAASSTWRALSVNVTGCSGFLGAGVVIWFLAGDCREISDMLFILHLPINDQFRYGSRANRPTVSTRWRNECTQSGPCF